jgi:hypothetical protein
MILQNQTYLSSRKIIAEEIIEEYVNLHYDIDKLLLSAAQ